MTEFPTSWESKAMHCLAGVFRFSKGDRVGWMDGYILVRPAQDSACFGNVCFELERARCWWERWMESALSISVSSDNVRDFQYICLGN